MIVEKMLLYTFKCQYRYMIFFMLLHDWCDKLQKNIRKNLGEAKTLVAEGESLKIVSEFLCKNLIVVTQRRFPFGFWKASVA